MTTSVENYNSFISNIIRRQLIGECLLLSQKHQPCGRKITNVRFEVRECTWFTTGTQHMEIYGSQHMRIYGEAIECFCRENRKKTPKKEHDPPVDFQIPYYPVD